MIAIGNVRLFEEVQARTRELQDPSSTRPRLAMCSTSSAVLHRTSSRCWTRSSTRRLVFVAATSLSFGSCTRGGTTSLQPPAKPRRSSPPTRAQIRLTLAVRRSLAALRPGARLFTSQMSRSTRNIVGRTDDGSAFSGQCSEVPLLRDGAVIGVIAVHRRLPQPFSQREIDLVITFADQAVIAINNVALFEEVQARTRDLTEALEQQTATSEVLQAISRSTFDLDAVLETLVQSAARLCEADISTITRQKDEVYYRGAFHGFPPDFAERIRGAPVELTRGNATGRALLEGTVVHIEDVKADPDYTFVEAQEAGQFRTVLGVPLLRQGTPIGAIALARRALRPFSERQIELVQTFADQAVIAIENVRLFEEVQSRTAGARALGRGAPGARRGQPRREFYARSRDRALHDRREGRSALGHGGRRDLRVQQAAPEVPPAGHLRHERGDDRRD